MDVLFAVAAAKRLVFNSHHMDERHNNSLPQNRRPTRNNGNHSHGPCTRIDNKTDSSPVYSNQQASAFILDQKMQEHLLPLQQYILEQAKLSGQSFY